MRKHITIFLFLSLVLGHLYAQDEKDIGTETVTVVKPYSPTVSDAFKLKRNPDLNDSIVLQKKPIKYNISSVPVASTYTPAKAKADRVEKTPPPTLYNTSASVGLGNFNNALVDFYTSREFGRDENLLDVGLKHHSSRGFIDEPTTLGETDFYNTDLDVAFSKKDRDKAWGAGIALGHQLYHWYGVREDLENNTLFPISDIGVTDTRQNYFNAEAKAHIDLEDSFFKSGKVTFRRFWDAVDSGENRLVLEPTIEVPITQELVTIKTKLDYVAGSFENSSLNSTDNIIGSEYGQLQVGVNPSLLILRDDLTLNLGANLVYGADIEGGGGSFFIYPAVTASYRLVDETVIAYGGIEGQLNQNSYYDFVEENPYVSPTLFIQPTDQQYEGYVGLKGQLLPNLGYNIKGSFTAENRKPLFLLNPLNDFRNDEKVYTLGNSFQVFYDDLRTLGIFGEVNVDVNRNFSLGINAEFYNYNTETDNPAWNLPTLKGSLFMDYQISEQWFAGANLFYVGERDDLLATAQPNTLPNLFPSQIVTLEGFFDANAHLGYRFNEQLSIFAKASNIANNNYQQWANFRVQGFQVLAGATYKFDF